MNKLMFEERKQGLFDNAHGVAKVQEETPEFMEWYIRELDASIAVIPPKTQVAKDLRSSHVLETKIGDWSEWSVQSDDFASGSLWRGQSSKTQDARRVVIFLMTNANYLAKQNLSKEWPVTWASPSSPDS
jgi:hypothetical protein